MVPEKITFISVLAFFSNVFIQSGVDKVFDYKGNLIRNKKNKKLIPKIGGDPLFGKDIRSNTDLPKTLI